MWFQIVNSSRFGFCHSKGGGRRRVISFFNEIHVLFESKLLNIEPPHNRGFSFEYLTCVILCHVNLNNNVQLFDVFTFIFCQVAASGKAILITGCESPLAWCLARKLDEIGFTIFAGFTKRTGNSDADLLKEESSGRTKILQLDVTSETQVRTGGEKMAKNSLERTNERK